MKAVLQTKYGGSEALKLKNIEKLNCKSNEILVKVVVTTLNRSDCGILRGTPLVVRLILGFRKPKKHIMGTDFAGIIEKVGANVHSYKVGDRVMGFNDGGLCSCAEYITVDQSNLNIAAIPLKLGFEEAVSCLEGFHYAYNIINKIELEKGQKVLVNGATGAIGSATVQLAKYFNANVTAVCRGEHSEQIKALGADKLVDYTIEDFTKTVEIYDYIFDTVGKSSFYKCKKILKKGGVYISTELGKNSQNIFLSLSTVLFGNKKVKFPFPSNIPRSMNLVIKMVEEEKFSPLIDKKYSMEKIREAFEYVNSGQKAGNVIIKVE